MAETAKRMAVKITGSRRKASHYRRLSSLLEGSPAMEIALPIQAPRKLGKQPFSGYLCLLFAAVKKG